MSWFRRLFMLALVRKGSSIVSFYFGWVLIELIAATVVGGITMLAFRASVGMSASFTAGIFAGDLVVLILSADLAYLIMKAKAFPKNSNSLMLIIGAALLSALGGILLGLIIPTYLTTRASTVILPQE